MIEIAAAHARSSAPAGAYFARWVDHATWPEWSPDTDWVRIDGPVRTGATGALKPRGGPKVKIVVRACEPGREYTDEARFPGARLTFQHTVAPVGDGVELGVRVGITGPLARLWAAVLGKGFRTSVQPDLDRLVALVERAA